MADTKIFMYSNRAYLDADHQEQFMTTALKEAFLEGSVIILGTSSIPDHYECATPIGYYETLDPNDKVLGNLMYIPIAFNPSEVRMALSTLGVITGWPDTEDSSDTPTTLIG